MKSATWKKLLGIGGVLIAILLLFAYRQVDEKNSRMASAESILLHWSVNTFGRTSNDEAILKLDEMFRDEGMKLVEFQVVNELTSEVLIGTISNRKKLNSWFPRENKVGDMIWVEYNYTGYDGSYQVFWFNFPTSKPSIKIIGIVR